MNKYRHQWLGALIICTAPALVLAAKPLAMPSAAEIQQALSSTMPEKVEYNEGNKRNPFSLPARAKSASLGQEVIAGRFTVESMRLLGTFVSKAGEKKWAFIVSSDGGVHKIVPGSVVGSRRAKVVKIDHHQVVFREGDGTAKRMITLNISEPE